MISHYYHIHRFNIRDDEWHLLDALPKHELCNAFPNFCRYYTISAEGTLLDTFNVTSDSIRILSLPEFIEKFNEYRLFLLL